MIEKSYIDMSKPQMAYAAGVGALMLFSLLMSNVPALSLSNYFDIPYRRLISAGLFLTGTALGGLAIHRHMLRSKKPWKHPQSQVSLPYAGALLCMFIATALTK